MKMKKTSRRLVALLLSCSMLATGTFSGTAFSKEKEDGEQSEKTLKTLLSQSGRDYKNGAFAFYETQITGAEGQDSELTVVRVGAADKKASVTIKAVDVTAKNGEDYLMSVTEGSKTVNLEADANSKTLMEEYGGQLAEDESLSAREDSEKGTCEKMIPATLDGEKVSMDSLSGMDQAVAVQGNHVQDGMGWREIDANKKTANDSDAEELIRGGKESILQAAPELNGVSYTFSFEEGEYKKTIDLTAIDDDLAESDEQVMFLLYDAEGSELSDSYTAYYNIRDNEEKEVDTYRMSSKAISVRRGEASVDVTIEKICGTEQLSVVTVGTSELTAKPGVDYETMREDVIFAPGMTSKTVTVPLLTNAESSSDVSFYVGLQTENGVVKTSDNAALVTITGNSQASSVVYYASGVQAKDSASSDSKAVVFDGTKTIQAGSSSGNSSDIVSKVNLVGATNITIAYYSNEGATTVGSGCKAWTARDREASFQVKVGGSVKGTTNEQGASLGDGGSWKYLSIPVSGINERSAVISGTVTPLNSNTSATLVVKKVTVSYQGYTIKFNNSGRNNSTGKIINPDNVYQEKAITGSKTSTAGNYIKLGAGKINGEDSAIIYQENEGDRFSYVYNTENRTKEGVVPDSSNTRFLRFELQKGTSDQWTDIGTSMPDLKTLLTTYKEYMNSNNTFVFRPCFEVKKVKLKFKNNTNIKDPADSSKEVNKSKLGSFNGFDNGTEFKNMTLLDTLELSASPAKGYSITGFSMVTDNNQVVKQKDTKKDSTTVLIPRTTEDISIDINYTESKIEVKADPLGKDVDKGSVLYYDPDDSSNTVAGDCENPTTIRGISVGGGYKIFGLTKNQEPITVGEDSYVYRPTWRDGTLDTDDDGEISEKEKKAAPGYKEFSPVGGDVLYFSPFAAHSKIYYDFDLRKVGGSKGKRKATLTGRVYLSDKEIFSGRTKKTGVNGATVSAGNYSTETITYDAESSTTDKGPGYYSLDGDGTFYASDYMLLTVNYAGANGASVFTNAVTNPASFEQRIELSTYSVMDVDNASVQETVKSPVVAGDTESKNKTISYTAMNNGKHDYTLKFHIKSKNTDLKPVKATLRFYNSSGTEILTSDNKDTKVTKSISSGDDGYVSFKFNPADMELPVGTRLTLQAEDQNGNKYFERDTGIVLSESIGILDVVNTFNFGGLNSVVKLIGKIDSKLDLGWSGKLDAGGLSGEVKTTDDEYSIVIGYKFDEIKKDNTKKSLAEVAKEKANADVAYNKAKAAYEKESDTEKKAKAKEELDKAKEKQDESNKAYEEKVGDESTKKKSRSKLTANVSLQFGISFVLTFAKNTEKSSVGYGYYYFKEMILGATVSAGGAVNVSYATPIGVTISLGFSVNVDGDACFVVCERQDLEEPPKYYLSQISGLTEKDGTLTDSNGKINLLDGFSESSERGLDHYGMFDVNPTITITAGASVLGDMIKAEVEGSAKFKMQFFANKSGNNGMVNLSASISVHVLFVTGTWKFASKDINLFGTTASSRMTDFEQENYLYDDSGMLRTADKDYLDARGKWNSSRMTARSLVQNEKGVTETALLEGIYSGTDLNVVSIGSGDYLGVFLDDELDAEGNQLRADMNSSAVYYTLYNHETGSWSKPVLLEDDETLDEDLNVYDMGDRGIMVTWSTANKVLTEDMSRTDSFNTLNIHGVFFDKSSKTFGEVMEVTKDTAKDNVSDVSPNVIYNEDSVVVFYTKNQYGVSDASQGEMVGDAVYPERSYMAYRVYHFSSSGGTAGSWETDYSEELKETISDSADYDAYTSDWYGQVFVNTVPDVYLDEELDDNGYWLDDKEPAVYEGHMVTGSVEKAGDADSAIVNDSTQVSGVNAEDGDVLSVSPPKIISTDTISYNNLGLFAYIVDYDQDLSTVNDRDIFMQIYDFATGSMTQPVMITSDNKADENVKFVRAKDSSKNYEQTYLSWLSGGDVVAMNVSHLIESGCLLEKTSPSGQSFYMIDKSSDSGFEPVRTIVEGEVAEEDGAVSDISDFDVSSADGDIYIMWTEQKQTLKDGVEEKSEEAVIADNQSVENQIYMVRYNLVNGTITGDVQVTDGEGDNYNNLSFVVNEDATITALATKSSSKKVTREEFNEEIKDYNTTVSEDEQMDLLKAGEFTEYVAADTENKTLVALNIVPVSVMKVGAIDLSGLKEGADNTVILTLLNDGLDTLEKANLVVTNAAGENVIANEGTISGLVGGNTCDVELLIPMREGQTSEKIHVKLMDEQGNVRIDRTYSQNIAEEYEINNLTVTETDERDVYEVSFELEAGDKRFVSARELQLGIETSEGDVNLTAVKTHRQSAGTCQTYSAVVKVDSRKQFTETKGSDGSVSETGTFYVSDGSKQRVSTDVVRKAAAGQMEDVRGITEGVIGSGGPISLAVHQTEKQMLNLKSSLTDESIGQDGTEGLQVIWKTESEGIASVDSQGVVTANGVGQTKLFAYVLPQNSVVVANGTEGADAEYNFAEEVNCFHTMPNAAILTYSTTIKVTEGGVMPETPSSGQSGNTPGPGGGVSNPGSSTPSGAKSVTKKGITYKISGKTAAVSKVKKSLKTAVIPATVKVKNKKYKVTAISPNACKGCKKLTKVIIGKNVKTIGKKAFFGCGKLRRITFKGSRVRKIGAKAFSGIHRKAVFCVPKTAKKKYKKLLKKKKITVWSKK